MYLFFNSNLVNPKLLVLKRAGNGYLSVNFLIERDCTYPYSNMHYVAEGCVILEINKKTYTINKGELFIVPKFTAHKYYTKSDNAVFVNWMEFSGNSILEFESFFCTNDIFVFPTHIANKTDEYLLNILKLSQNYPKNCYEVSKLIYSIYLELTEYIDTSIHLDHIENDFITHAINYINLHLKDNLNITKLAKLTNYSTNYFHKLFLQKTHVTPAKYILNAKINKAKELLCEYNEKTDVISEQLGFCDTSHFIRVFKKAEGLTPTEFKKQSKLYDF